MAGARTWRARYVRMYLRPRHDKENVRTGTAAAENIVVATYPFALRALAAGEHVAFARQGSHSPRRRDVVVLRRRPASRADPFIPGHRLRPRQLRRGILSLAQRETI